MPGLLPLILHYSSGVLSGAFALFLEIRSYLLFDNKDWDPIAQFNIQIIVA